MVTYRYTLPRPVGERAEDQVVAWLWAAGALGMWVRDDALLAWFPSPSTAVPPGGWWDEEPDRDWQEGWKTTIGPVRAGRIVVVPSWLAERHSADPDGLVIVLDPGRAFGSGHHPTTLLCLELLQRVAVAGRRVLDVGCGSGILAIAAARLGAASCVAVDIDPDAVAVAAANAAVNQVEVLTIVGSVDAGGTGYDVVVANLSTDTLTQLAPQLVAAVRPGGCLIASGVGAERAEVAAAALAAAGLTALATVVRGEWVALHGQRPPDHDIPSPSVPG